jgi:23S rRNA (uracil1939-C5)-methyltransferase
MNAAPALACPHCPPCPGCPLIALPYAEQLVQKHAEIVRALAGLVPAEHIGATVPSPRLAGYRNQSRLMFARGYTGRIEIGLYAMGTHRVIPIPRCPIQPEGMNAIARTTGRLAREMRLLVYDERTRRGHLRYLVLRADHTRRRFLVGIVAAAAADDPRLASLAARLRNAHPEIAGITLLENLTAGNVILAGEERWTVGEARIPDRIGDVDLSVSMRSFLQVNHEVAALLAVRIADWAAERIAAEDREKSILLDLYSGVGLIAMHLARRGLRVVAVERVEAAVADAEAIRARSEFAARLRFIAASTERFLDDPGALAPELKGAPLALAVVNPPRAGLTAAVLTALDTLGPRAIAYVSCNPAALARDLRQLAEHYEITAVTPFDMLPLTTHIEALALLVRRGAAAPGPHPA